MRHVVCSTLLRQLCDRISQRNQNGIRKYFGLFIRGPAGFESRKKTGGRYSLDTLPLTNLGHVINSTVGWVTFQGLRRFLIL